MKFEFRNETGAMVCELITDSSAIRTRHPILATDEASIATIMVKARRIDWLGGLR